MIKCKKCGYGFLFMHCPNCGVDNPYESAAPDRANTDSRDAAKALRELVDALDRCVYVITSIGPTGYHGPTYADELKAARAVLDAIEQEKK